MRDRLLDQLVMCSLYIVCKVWARKWRKFTDYAALQPATGGEPRLHGLSLLKHCGPRRLSAARQVMRHGRPRPPPPGWPTPALWARTGGGRGPIKFTTQFTWKRCRKSLRWNPSSGQSPLFASCPRIQPASPAERCQRATPLYQSVEAELMTNSSSRRPWSLCPTASAVAFSKGPDAINAMVRGRSEGGAAPCGRRWRWRGRGRAKLLIWPTRPRGGAIGWLNSWSRSGLRPTNIDLGFCKINPAFSTTDVDIIHQQVINKLQNVNVDLS